MKCMICGQYCGVGVMRTAGGHSWALCLDHTEASICHVMSSEAWQEFDITDCKLRGAIRVNADNLSLLAMDAHLARIKLFKFESEWLDEQLSEWLDEQLQDEQLQEGGAADNKS